MAQAALTEAPLKRRLEGATETVDSKKPRQEDPTEIDGNLASDCNVACNSELKLASSAEPSREGESKATEIDENLLEGYVKSATPSVEASGSGSAGIEESETLGEGEVLEAALVQEADDEEQGDEEEEISEIDTENDSVADEEEEDAGSDEDEDEDEDDSDDEEDEVEMPTSTSTKGKGIEEGKGKEKVVDVKGKGIMLADKGKGKAIAEDEAAPGSDEDDAGYLSEDPLDEVDLNNILPTRTRRRSSTHYDFVDHGDEQDDDDDDDSDA